MQATLNTGETVNIGTLSKPASRTAVRPLSLSERHDQAAREAKEHEAALRAAYLSSPDYVPAHGFCS